MKYRPKPSTIEVEEKQIIRFPQGLPAFEDHRQFVFLLSMIGIFLYAVGNR